MPDKNRGKYNRLEYITMGLGLIVGTFAPIVAHRYVQSPALHDNMKDEAIAWVRAIYDSYHTTYCGVWEQVYSNAIGLGIGFYSASNMEESRKHREEMEGSKLIKKRR